MHEPGPPRSFEFRLAIASIAVFSLLRVAFLALEVVPLYGDEAQYWSWSLDLTWGYFSKPPMIAWLIWLTTTLFGSGEFGVKLASPLCHAITSMVLLLLGSRLYDRRVGGLAALVFLTMPAVSYSSAIISTDPPLLMLWALALFAFVLARDSGSLGWWLACGVALGAAMLSKYTAIAFPVSLLLFLLASGRTSLLRSVGPYLALATASVIVLPNALWNARVGFITVRHISDTAKVSGPALHLDRLAEFLGSQLLVFGPVYFVVLIGLLLRWRRSSRDDNLLLLLSFVAPLLAAFSVQALLSRANANWAAPIFVSASLAVAAALRDHRRWLFGSILAHTVLGLTLYAYEPVRLLLEARVPARYDLLADVREWPELGRRVAELHRRYPETALLFEYRMVHAECLYYASLPLEQTFSWNKHGGIRNHYDLVRDLDQAVGRNLLLISRTDDTESVRPYVDAVHLLERIEIQTHPDRVRSYSVLLLEHLRETPRNPQPHR